MSVTSPPVLRDAQLDDRYTARSGPALLGGIQALVRLLIEQRRLDGDRELNTGMYVSGYPGSPLGGLDREIARASRFLEPLGVVFEPAVNEELAATAVAGTQLVGELPGRERDGVTGLWYGKAPGLDRAADAIRHGNVSGTAALGGAVALIGDDPLCKSSTLPSSCELMAESLMLPLLAPATVGEIVGLGLHAVAMSRAAGLWTALKIVSDVADASEVVQLTDPAQLGLPAASAGRGGPPVLIGSSAVAAEHDLISRRLRLARDYGHRHGLNRIVFEPARPRTTLVAPGAAFAVLRRALTQLGLGTDELQRLGVRLVSLGLVWPLHRDDVGAFAAGVDELVVVEDKRPFVERQLRDLLYGAVDAPAVVGKRDRDGAELVSAAGAVDADQVAESLVRVFGDRLAGDARPRASTVRGPAADAAGPAPVAVARTPFFCSGCPHNLSTRTDPDQLVGAGIGCHALIWLDRPGRRGRILGAPQMGGEGAQWLGMAPFTCDRHYVQNMGDGTFHHSGSLAIRAAVAAGSQITFRLLYNDAIAMTGGQAAPGRMGVPELARWLRTEGVRRVIVTTEDVASFDGVSLPDGASVRDRSQLQAALAELERLDGVTVLIHTDRCATEERRLRKRGALPTPNERVWINERVCEGCGDCGEKSSCLSVVPVKTAYGRKTRIHQSSCTQDLACLDGDCPSFVVLRPAVPESGAATAPPPLPGRNAPEPVSRFADDQPVLIRMPGVGGTGVVTVSQVLQMAASLQGGWAAGLDQTGLAQKGGPVVSDVRLGRESDGGSPRAAAGEVDVLLGLELLGAVAPETLNTLDPERTVAVVNVHETATAAMVADPAHAPLPLADCVARVRSATVADEALLIDAGTLAESLFGDHMPVNVLLLGAAYQHGCIPLSAAAIERAIELNGAAVAVNLAAFAWGRAVAADPAGALAQAADASATPTDDRSVPAPIRLPRSVSRRLAEIIANDRLGQLLADRAADLCAYQDAAYARRYLDDVAEVLARERQTTAQSPTPVTDAYARSLHKLMAYKDEYEVARLHRDAVERARRDATFGPGASARVMLHPPLLRALGLRRKLGVDASVAEPLFAALHTGRRLRGTRLDPFGRTELRRLERALVDEHRVLTRRALALMTADNVDAVANVAGLADQIRGYEQVKLRSVARYREAADAALSTLAGNARA